MKFKEPKKKKKKKKILVTPKYAQLLTQIYLMTDCD